MYFLMATDVFSDMFLSILNRRTEYTEQNSQLITNSIFANITEDFCYIYIYTHTKFVYLSVRKLILAT